MTHIIAEPCIDIKDRSCVDVCPVDRIHEFERILRGLRARVPGHAIFPEDALPDKWEAFVPINYAFPDPEEDQRARRRLRRRASVRTHVSHILQKLGLRDLAEVQRGRDLGVRVRLTCFRADAFRTCCPRSGGSAGL